MLDEMLDAFDRGLIPGTLKGLEFISDIKCYTCEELWAFQSFIDLLFMYFQQ